MSAATTALQMNSPGAGGVWAKRQAGDGGAEGGLCQSREAAVKTRREKTHPPERSGAIATSAPWFARRA